MARIPRLRKLLVLRDPAWLRLGRAGSAAFLVIGCCAIAGWQLVFAHHADRLDRSFEPSYARTGYFEQQTPTFFYFLYYTGHFPICTTIEPENLDWSREGARALLSDGSLCMEMGTYLRTGDWGKILLLYPAAWVAGSPRHATLLTFNRALGILSLLALFVSLCLLEHRLLAALLVAALGSHPMELVSLYADNNVFGYPIPIASLLMALHAPLILGHRRGLGVFAIPVFAGIILASVREVRPEPFLLVLSVAGTYATAEGGWRRRVLLLAVFGLCLAGTGRLWSHHWERRFSEAYATVSRAGGETYDGPRNRHHAMWHALWCGLGDFASDRGYAWDDREAFAWALPEMNRRFGTHYSRRRWSYELRQYHTSARQHRIQPETLEEYTLVVRDKVLGDILDDPLWYADVLRQRLGRFFEETAPVRLGLGTYRVDVPFSGWLLLPALVVVTCLRRWETLKLLAFFLPVNLAAVTVYSGGGITYGSAYPQVLFAVMGCWILHAAGLATRRRRAVPIAEGTESTPSWVPLGCQGGRRGLSRSKRRSRP